MSKLDFLTILAGVASAVLWTLIFSFGAAGLAELAVYGGAPLGVAVYLLARR